MSGIFDSVMAGVDGTRAGFEAVRQAARLVEPDGRLMLAAVQDGRDVLGASWGGRSFATLDADGEWTFEMRETELRTRIEASLASAAEQVDARPAPELRRVGSWSAWEGLCTAAEETDATLLVVGTHGRSRALGILLGQTATHLAHNAPCSVLIARPPFDPRRFPASLVVGLDGSPAADRALDVAIAIAARWPGLEGRVLACRPALPGLLHREVTPKLPEGFTFSVTPQVPSDGLVEEAEGADLLVVGARGVGAVRALGSTAERVAHRSSSSVLLVRGG